MTFKDISDPTGADSGKNSCHNEFRLPDEVPVGFFAAIPTWYKNTLFRSRLEARWAVFFETLGIRWEFELQGYDMDGTWYLPDFYLPEFNGGTYVEVKPTRFTWDEDQKSIVLCEGSGHSVFKAEGSPSLKFYEIFFNYPNQGCYRMYSNFHIHYKAISENRFWIEPSPYQYALKDDDYPELVNAIRQSKKFRF